MVEAVAVIALVWFVSSVGTLWVFSKNARRIRSLHLDQQMSGHRLNTPARHLTHYSARCSCGLQVWGKSLPEVWMAHSIHLNAVRELIEEEW